jgi:hypothetical protein
VVYQKQLPVQAVLMDITPSGRTLGTSL